MEEEGRGGMRFIISNGFPWETRRADWNAFIARPRGGVGAGIGCPEEIGVLDVSCILRFDAT